MKKTYVKPQVYFESFQLSANIAGGCSLISQLAEHVCPITDKELGITYFAKEICEYTAPGDNDEPCYDIPSDATHVFTS